MSQWVGVPPCPCARTGAPSQKATNPHPDHGWRPARVTEGSASGHRSWRAPKGAISVPVQWVETTGSDPPRAGRGLSVGPGPLGHPPVPPPAANPAMRHTRGRSVHAPAKQIGIFGAHWCQGCLLPAVKGDFSPPWGPSHPLPRAGLSPDACPSLWGSAGLTHPEEPSQMMLAHKPSQAAVLGLFLLLL